MRTRPVSSWTVAVRAEMAMATGDAALHLLSAGLGALLGGSGTAAAGAAMPGSGRGGGQAAGQLTSARRQKEGPRTRNSILGCLSR